MSPTLKACPFCGSDEDVCIDVLTVDDETLDPADQTPILWGVGCQCTGFVGPFDSEAAAVTAWNRRAAPPVTDETIERIAKAIFLAEHPDAEWSAGRARAVWFTRAEAALQEITP